MPGEIIPISAEISRPYGDNEDANGPEKALDMDFSTTSRAVPQNQGGAIWIRLEFNQSYCVKQVTWFNYDGNHMYIWTCDEIACNDCNNGSGVICSAYSVTVTNRGRSGPQTSKPGCKYGDMVTVVRNPDQLSNIRRLNFYELAAGLL